MGQLSHNSAVKIEREWAKVEAIKRDLEQDRIAMGRAFNRLRELYSDRNSGGRRLTSGHGDFEKQCIKRGHKPRTVRGYIKDFHASENGSLSESQKRAARRKKSQPRIAQGAEQLARFAALLPFEVARDAYHEAAKAYHPDRGGSEERMQLLNAAWSDAKQFYQTAEDIRSVVHI
jgi:hypothetical protein